MSLQKHCLLIALLLLLPLTGQADTLLMKNGDTLSGTVVKLDGGTLTFKTDYAGKLKIDWQQVELVNSDTALALEIDKTTQKGQLVVVDQQQLLVSEEKREAIELTKLNAINPPDRLYGFRYKGHLRFGAELDDGNTDKEQYHTEAKLEARKDVHRLNAFWQSNYANSDGIRSEDNQRLSLQYDHFFSPKWYYNTTVSFERDSIKALNLRYLLGVGLGHQFWDEDRRQFKAEVGLAYINEDYSDGNPDNNYTAFRWAIDYERQPWDTNLTLFHRHNGLQALNDTNLLFYSQTGLKIPFADNFHAALQVNYDWQKEPAEGNEKADTKYLINLGYDL